LEEIEQEGGRPFIYLNIIHVTTEALPP
jgi:hypothetical protein